MSRDDIQRLFTDLAEDVGAPAFAAAAWDRARHVRRQRLAAGAAAVAVVAVLGVIGVTVKSSHHGVPPVPPVGSPSVSAGHAAVDILPAHIPDRPDGFLPASFTPPSDAPPLSSRPFQVVVALYSPAMTDCCQTIPPMYIYGRYADDTTGWARLPVALTWATDGANTSLPMRPTSLGPNGRWAVFPQPGGVVAVDLATGVAHTVTTGGLMEDVAWLPDGEHVIVTGGDDSFLVDLVTGKVARTDVRAGDVATLYADGADTMTWTWTGGTASGPQVISDYNDAGTTVRRRFDVDQSMVAPYGFDEPFGPATRRGHVLVRSGFGRNDHEIGGQYVMAVDDVSGAVTRMLSVGFDVQKGCCGLLGWSGDAVVFNLVGTGVLGWNPTTGEVVRLAPPTAGLISLASYGCDWEIAIDGAGSACVT